MNRVATAFPACRTVGAVWLNAPENVVGALSVRPVLCDPTTAVPFPNVKVATGLALKLPIGA